MKELNIFDAGKMCFSSDDKIVITSYRMQFRKNQCKKKVVKFCRCRLFYYQNKQ